MKRLCLALALLLGSVSQAGAVDFDFNGYGDLRIFVPPNTESYLQGGLGKLRSDEYYGTPSIHAGELVGVGSARLTAELTATATGRINPDYGTAADLLEAYLRYRPVSTTEWRWSVKLGAFFPPLSLENDQIGWSSFWTITPSAINSWVGNELRTIGAEGTLEWRREEGTATLTGALFGWNDPAGVMIADRGWNFDDRVAGLFEHSRLPNATAALLGVRPPLQAELFREIDHRVGWYIDLSWEPKDVGGIEIMRYDNNADPSAFAGGQFAWHTRFWDLGLQKQVGAVTLLAQGMIGTTTIQPSPSFRSDTGFRSAYALAGWDLDEWWLAARIDWFQTRTQTPFVSLLNEDGHAFTAAASWLPKKWLRLTGEVLCIDSTRAQRVVDGDDPHQIETQLQFVARAYF